jgi:hypothetical protein
MFDRVPHKPEWFGAGEHMIEVAYVNRPVSCASREGVRRHEELLAGRPLGVTVERIGAEHACE